MHVRLHHISADIDGDMIASVGPGVVVDAEQFGRVAKLQMTLLGQFPHQGGVKTFADLNPAARQMPAGNIGVSDQKHPALDIKGHTPYAERVGP